VLVDDTAELLGPATSIGSSGSPSTLAQLLGRLAADPPLAFQLS